MRKWDSTSSKSIDIVIANSNFVSDRIKKYWNRSWGVYPNLGIKNPEIDGKIEQIISNETWRCQVKEFLFEKPSVIGACCGSTPEHIRIIKEIIESESVD